jgi:hypothetical protein
LILYEIIILGAYGKNCIAIGAFTEVNAFVNDFFFWIWKDYGKSNGLGMAGSMDGFDDGAAIVGGDPVLDQFFRGGVHESVYGY